jgi:hypothetical protein
MTRSATDPSAPPKPFCHVTPAIMEPFSVLTMRKRTTVNGEHLRSFNWMLPNRLLNTFHATRGNPNPTGITRKINDASFANATFCRQWNVA